MRPGAAGSPTADTAAAAVAAHAIAPWLGGHGAVAARADQIAVGLRGSDRKRAQQSGGQREAAG
ncbi:hypothetical protein D3C71_1376270 [compost metagenome]